MTRGAGVAALRFAALRYAAPRLSTTAAGGR
jgi:hypothetical protein